MKLRKIVFLVCSSMMPLFAQVSFGDVDISDENCLIFSVNRKIPGEPRYKTFFSVEAGESGIAGNPEILTCFPDKMALINGGRALRISNRHGTAEFSFETGSLSWKDLSPDMLSENRTCHVEKISPDGKWSCLLRNRSLTEAEIVLVDLKTREEQVIVPFSDYSLSSVPVKWSPDSKILLYEKNGAVYFLTPEAAFKDLLVRDGLRKIGDGTIDSVQWTKDSIFYINGDIMYRILQNELHTRGLYSALVGIGSIAGRLPSPLDKGRDRFWVSPDCTKILVLKDKTFAYLYDLPKKNSFEYASVLAINSFVEKEKAVLECDVFWCSSKEPVVVLKQQDYRNPASGTKVYSAGQKKRLLHSSDCYIRPEPSPDGKYVAVAADGGVKVFTLGNDWREKAFLGGERVRSVFWKTSGMIIAGGERTVSLWKIGDKIEKSMLFISAADRLFWKGRDILCNIDNKSFVYDTKNKAWKLSSQSMEKPVPKEKNGKFRVFSAKCRNSDFQNGLYVRSLAASAETYPVWAETEKDAMHRKTVSLHIDARQSAEDLPEVLEVLKKYGIGATFFLNGEFIRRYPQETKQISDAGHTCASMFYSSADLLEGSLLLDPEFIKRGLARNEDEFFAVTGKELSTMWHPPYYNTNDEINSAAKDAGYTTAECDLARYLENLPAKQLIKDYMYSVRDKGVLTVSLDSSQKDRKDRPAQNLEVLVVSVLNAGYNFESCPKDTAGIE